MGKFPNPPATRRKRGTAGTAKETLECPQQNPPSDRAVHYPFIPSANSSEFLRAPSAYSAYSAVPTHLRVLGLSRSQPIRVFRTTILKSFAFWRRFSCGHFRKFLDISFTCGQESSAKCTESRDERRWTKPPNTRTKRTVGTAEHAEYAETTADIEKG